MTQRARRILVYIIITSAFVILSAVAAQTQSELSDAVNDVAALSVSNHGLVTSLQSALVESCEKNGNAQRQVQRETLHEEIHAAKHIDPAIKRAFNIPPAKLDQLIADNVKRLQRRLGRVHAVDCAAQYKISPGSEDRRRGQSDSSS